MRGKRRVSRSPRPETNIPFHPSPRQSGGSTPGLAALALSVPPAIGPTGAGPDSPRAAGATGTTRGGRRPRPPTAAIRFRIGCVEEGARETTGRPAPRPERDHPVPTPPPCPAGGSSPGAARLAFASPFATGRPPTPRCRSVERCYGHALPHQMLAQHTHGPAHDLHHSGTLAPTLRHAGSQARKFPTCPKPSRSTAGMPCGAANSSGPGCPRMPCPGRVCNACSRPPTPR